MSHFLEFRTDDGGSILVEVEGEPDTLPAGEVEAGLGQKVREAIVKTQLGFNEAIMGTMFRTVEAFTARLRSLEMPPDTAELTFGLKAVLEVGHAAVSKAGGDANYTVRLVWRHRQAGSEPPEAD